MRSLVSTAKPFHLVADARIRGLCLCIKRSTSSHTNTSSVDGTRVRNRTGRAGYGSRPFSLVLLLDQNFRQILVRRKAYFTKKVIIWTNHLANLRKMKEPLWHFFVNGTS